MSNSRPEVTVRPATAADLPVIGLLGAALVRLHHEFDPKRFRAASLGTEHGYASFLGSQLKEADTCILVAEQGGEVVGYSYSTVEGVDYMTLRGPAGVINDIWIEPGHRGSGVGRFLLDATIAALEARGMSQVVLSTAVQNQAAQGLFASAGFRQTMIEMTREK